MHPGMALWMWMLMSPQMAQNIFFGVVKSPNSTDSE
jgi:hypothetical protein